MARSSPSRRSASRSTRSRPVVEITTYQAAVRHLLDRTDHERMRLVRYDADTFKLDRMRALMKKLGDPQDHIRTVHVAGTVGKGSTVAMIADVLQASGYAVGRYTSPHLTDLRERVVINGHLIAKTDFTRQVAEISEAARAIDLQPTFFEMMTAIAFRYFAEEAVDVAVIEVGLGGRLDSTNLITPEASVITQIDLDHMHLLGNTVEKIAAEKAGIMKPGVPVFTHEQSAGVETVLREHAERIGAPVRVIGKDVEFSSRFGADAERGPHCRICLITENAQYMHLPVPLPGEHQALNCGLAMAVVDHLRIHGFPCEETRMLAGLDAVRVPGRMEIVRERPRVLLDGAHNPIALTSLMRTVGAQMPFDSMICVFGCCEDKDVPAMLETAARGGDKFIFTRARGNPRAADPEDLQRIFNDRCGKMSQVAPTLEQALDLAGRAVGRDDLICITGSFYLVGEARKLLADRAKA